ncbi:MAG: VOC family protein [Rhodospirillaceae bacterium]|nr:VOC family protein [Rhodospirillaceae bacterium]MBT3491092.1 VOC family protein [Rhodospirillaceae bacterium]MBT3781830.1 VOC family protein [Rhodospirillaceae bacterium]MBT3975323.1 VOC family protein [Rhodospirillaceae bacterium]MBT4171216.1 VOC family protein [Rhodospirillaceae bacterium]
MVGIHAYIEVSELALGMNFYCDGLGLSLKRQLSPRWVELQGAGTPIYLLGNRPETADLGSTSATRSFERHWTPVHLDFVVTSLDEMVKRLLDFGATRDQAIKEREYGRIANMADPFGNGFDLIEFAGDGYEAVSRSV